jgi:UDP-N-acetylmuramoyl-tripeptide--D-alanyl-D-alanine ligase
VNRHSGSDVTVRFTAGQIVEATGGELLRGSAGQQVCGVSTDTRTIGRGELFVALKGPNHDGHNFVSDAVERGAGGTLLQKGERPFPTLPEAPGEFFMVAVDDTLTALGDLAAAHRARSKARVVAITGSVGKTTTKEMMATVLRSSHRVTATEKNHNNLVGVPETVFRLGPDDEVLIVELGTDRPGEMARLAEIVKPDIGVITQIAESHLQGFGDLVSVAEEKAEMFRTLPPDGHAVLREGIVFESLIRARTGAPITTFGVSESANVRAGDVRLDPEGTVRFRVVADGSEIEVVLAACGRHQAWNALAAFAACGILGVPAAEIAEGLGGFREQWGRMQRWRTKQGAWVIHDGYNANPASVRAAVETLAGISAARRTLVLGEMLDLGTHSARLHRQIGREIGRWPIDDFVVCGDRWEEYVEGAMEGGVLPESIHPFPTHEEIIRYLRDRLGDGDVVLVKGSRATKMETICDSLPAAEPAGTGLDKETAEATGTRTAAATTRTTERAVRI